MDYPLSPAASYPEMINATVKALEYLATNGPHDCTDEPGQGPPLFIAGDSSGGGLAYSALLSVHSGQRPLFGGRVHLAGAFFFSPWLNMRCNTSTYLNNAYTAKRLIRGKVFHGGDIAFKDEPEKAVADSLENALEYLGSHELLDDPIASPFNAGPELLRGLPPLLFVVASNELITGDTVISAQRAAGAGVDVILDVYDNMWHDFPMYSDGCGSGEPLWSAQRALRRTGRFLRDVAATGLSPCRTATTRAPGLPVTSFYIQGTQAGDNLKEASSDGFPCPRSQEGPDTIVSWAGSSFSGGSCEVLLPFGTPTMMVCTALGINVIVLLFVCRHHCTRSGRKSGALPVPASSPS